MLVTLPQPQPQVRCTQVPVCKVLHSPTMFSCLKQSCMKLMQDPYRAGERCPSRLIQQRHPAKPKRFKSSEQQQGAIDHGTATTQQTPS